MGHATVQQLNRRQQWAAWGERCASGMPDQVESSSRAALACLPALVVRHAAQRGCVRSAGGLTESPVVPRVGGVVDGLLGCWAGLVHLSQGHEVLRGGRGGERKEEMAGMGWEEEIGEVGRT